MFHCHGIPALTGRGYPDALMKEIWLIAPSGEGGD